MKKKKLSKKVRNKVLGIITSKVTLIPASGGEPIKGTVTIWPDHSKN
jgi:ribosomal protein S17E